MLTKFRPDFVVVFDFDGVVINSMNVQRKALFESHKAIVGKGEPSFEEFLNHSGDSISNIFQKMGLPLEMIPVYVEVSRNSLSEIQVFDGIRDLLRTLNNKGVKCAICTGKDKSRTLEILKYLDLDKYFQAVCCSDEVENPKPHQESLLLALNRLNASKDNAVMIGDAVNDIYCARDAGVKSIAVTWGEVDFIDLKNANPNFLVETVSELGYLIFRLVRPDLSIV